MNYEKIYEYRFKDINQNKKMAVWSELAKFIWAKMGRPHSVLDPAAGSMEFLRYVPAQKRTGVDLMRPNFDFDKFGIVFHQGNIFDIQLRPEYDGVFVSNFLEHLNNPEEVQTFLLKIHSILKPGGQIAIMGPNFKHCSSEYFDCADHKLILTDVAVAEHLYSTGFMINQQYSKFLPYSFRSRLPSSAPLTKLYLACPWAWRFLGKQFLIIGTK